MRAVLTAAMWDAVAVVAVFLLSCLVNDTSRALAATYWSLHPPLLALYWAFSSQAGALADEHRQGAVLAVLLVWGAQLTYTSVRRWMQKGWAREAEQQLALRREYGRAYVPVSFLVSHLLPSVLLFLTCLPVHLSVAGKSRAFSATDAVAYAICIGGVCLECIADVQLRAFMEDPAARRQGVLSTGVWGWSRHPNYTGEMALWWGIWLFGASAAPQHIWWTVFGPLATTLMFLGYSIPHDEARMAALHPEAWALVKLRVSRWLLWPPRSDAAVQAALRAQTKKGKVAPLGAGKGKGKGAKVGSPTPTAKGPGEETTPAVRSPSKAAARRGTRT